jgi:hypothetical protein
LPGDSVQRRNIVALVFDRNQNTFNWAGRTSLDTTTAGLAWTVDHLSLANIIRQEASASGPGTSVESNRHALALKVERPLSQTFAFHTSWSSLVYDDNRSVGLSNASFHTLLAGVDVMPLPFFSLSPSAGYRWDNQAGIRDRGPAYDIAAETRDLVVDGYRVDGKARIHVDRPDPRLLERQTGLFGIQKQFTPAARDSIQAAVYRNRREYYTAGDSTIESRTEQAFSLANLIEYAVDPALVTAVYVGLSSRSFDRDARQTILREAPVSFDTRIQEFRLETYVQAEYRRADGSPSAALRLAYSERDETHGAKLPSRSSPSVQILWAERNRQEQTKDNLARRTSLSGFADFPVSSSDSLHVAGSASILRYDTPSTHNVEDRDELLVALSIGSSHRFSPVLNLGVTVDGSLSRLVYLLRDRSANNTHNRVLRLTARTDYQAAKWLLSSNTVEVLANYTVYDFETRLAQARSFSYRQFALIDSTVIRLSPRVALDFFAYLKLYERGQLTWSEFVERPENRVMDRTVSLDLRFSPAPASIVSVGLRYFSQSRYRYESGIRMPLSFLSSVGPTCALQWQPGTHTRLQLNGWYERRKQPDGSVRGLPTMTFTFLVNL